MIMKKLTKKILKKLFLFDVLYSDKVIMGRSVGLFIDSIAMCDESIKLGLEDFLYKNKIYTRRDRNNTLDELIVPKQDRVLSHLQKSHILVDYSDDIRLRLFVCSQDKVSKWIDEDYVVAFELDTIHADNKYDSVFFDEGCFLYTLDPDIHSIFG